jgi:hypothetical protein
MKACSAISKIQGGVTIVHQQQSCAASRVSDTFALFVHPDT